jgi:hypothetical protein
MVSHKTQRQHRQSNNQGSGPNSTQQVEGGYRPVFLNPLEYQYQQHGSDDTFDNEPVRGVPSWLRGAAFPFFLEHPGCARH